MSGISQIVVGDFISVGRDATKRKSDLFMSDDLLLFSSLYDLSSYSMYLILTATYFEFNTGISFYKKIHNACFITNLIIILK